MKIFEALTFAPASGIDDVDSSFMAVRRRACQTLVKLGSLLPDKLLPGIDPIASTILKFFAEGRVLDNEKSYLIESIVLIWSAFIISFLL